MRVQKACRRSSRACAASGSKGSQKGPHLEIEQILKSDVFGRVRRVGDVVMREAHYARPWARALARHLLRREHRALARLALGDGIEGFPRLIDVGSLSLTRSWIEGAPMQIAKPRDPAYYRAASRLLRRMHTANVIHNDLAKETNWLVTPDGRPALVDFQLAMTLDKRDALSRSLGHDDLRHLLKHKRTYLPDALTAREKRILARQSLLSRLWMTTGKKIYLFVTRRILHWRDREGAGDRDISSGR